MFLGLARCFIWLPVWALLSLCQAQLSSFSFCSGKVLLRIALHPLSWKLGLAVPCPASRLCSDMSTMVPVPASLSGELRRPKDIQRVTVCASPSPAAVANTLSLLLFWSPSSLPPYRLPQGPVRAGPAKSGAAPQAVPLFPGQLVPAVRS